MFTSYPGLFSFSFFFILIFHLFGGHCENCYGSKRGSYFKNVILGEMLLSLHATRSPFLPLLLFLSHSLHTSTFFSFLFILSVFLLHKGADTYLFSYIPFFLTRKVATIDTLIICLLYLTNVPGNHANSNFIRKSFILFYNSV